MFTLDGALFTLDDDIINNDGIGITTSSIQPLNVLTTNRLRPPTLSKGLDFGIFEPTPIGPEGIVVVPSFPLHQEVMLSSPYPSQDDVLLDTVRKLSSANGLCDRQLTPMPVQTKCELTIKTTSSSSTSPPELKGCMLVDKWNKRFQELVAFRKKHGHCLVPFQKSESTELANWVKRQRNQYRRKVEGKSHTLSDKRQRALEGIGFVWDSRTCSWNKRYQELFQFWLENGNSKVPKNYKNNPALAIWVKHQRRQYKKRMARSTSSCISDERIRLLQALNFEFAPQR